MADPIPTHSRVWRIFQIVAIVALGVLLGVVMQLVKLASLDAAGRMYSQTSNGSKQAFLATFGVCKALANLAFGFMVQSVLRVKWSGALGWLACLAVPVLAGAMHSWPATIIANAFLGINQGFVWTALVLLVVPLFGSHQRGMAVGLLELVGYMSIAATAQLYGVLEHARVHCAWVDGGPPLLALSSSDGDAEGGDSASGTCAAVSNGECDKPDSWVAACAGLCVCHGYESLLGAGAAILAGAGLLVHVICLREQASSSSSSSTDDDGSQVSLLAGPGQGLRDHEAQGNLSHKSRQWRAARKAKGHKAAAGRQEAQALVDPNGPQEVTGDWDEDWEQDSSEEGGTGLEGAAGRAQRKRLEASRDMQAMHVELPQVRPGTGASAGSWSARMRETGLGLWRFTSGRGPAGRSTAVLCVAGLTCNVVTSVAWGLLLTWARDAIGVPGPARNLLAACYQYVMAGVLIAASLASDLTGRRWLVVGGLSCSAGGLLTAALGAGFQSGGEEGTPEAQDIMVLRYGYLVLGTVIMGCGQGLMYGTMAAATVDHSHPADAAISMSTFRFWRDLGYAVGAITSGVAADASSPEVAMIALAAVAGCVALGVAALYQEAQHHTQPEFAPAVVDEGQQLKGPRPHEATGVSVAARGGQHKGAGEVGSGGGVLLAALRGRGGGSGYERLEGRGDGGMEGRLGPALPVSTRL